MSYTKPLEMDDGEADDRGADDIKIKPFRCKLKYVASP